MAGPEGAPETSLPSDGERFIPGSMTGEIELEHIHRYKFAAQACVKRVVLDIACGEGYGSAYLARAAWRVTGVDISEDAIAHARAKYRQANLDFMVGNCTDIPLEDATVDVVVSFETIEHITEHEGMLREIKRVLRPRGTLIISSPDKLEYADKPGFRNPFHVRELYREELQSLLGKHFKHVRYFGQRVLYGSALFSETPHEIEFHDLKVDSKSRSSPAAPRYWVAVASNAQLRKIKGGLLEGSAAKHTSDGELAGARVAGAILKTIAGPASSHLRETLHEPWYLERNPDVAAERVDPFEHWMKCGASEGRMPASNVETLALELVAEREIHLRGLLERKERESRDDSAQWQTRLQALEEAQHVALTERERAFAEQLQQHQRVLSEERESQREAAARELSAAHADHAHREQRIRAEFAERERENKQNVQALLDRERQLVSKLEDARQTAHDQMEAQLRAQAERERAFAEQLMQLQKEASDEQTKERLAANALAQLILSQREQTERRLQATIADREREVRDLQREAVDQEKAMQAAVAQRRVALQYANDSHARALAEQQQGFAGQLARDREVVNAEREAERNTAKSALSAAQADLEATERQLTQTREAREAEQAAAKSALTGARADLEETERQLTQIREEREAERNVAKSALTAARADLEETERQLTQIREAREAGIRELAAVRTEYERRVERAIAELEQTRLSLRGQMEAQLRTLTDREREFARELAEQQQRADAALTLQGHVASQHLAETRADYAEQLQSSRSQLQALQSREREDAATQLRLLLEREHAFGERLARTRDLVEQERQLLRAHFMQASDRMREQLTAGEHRPLWRRLFSSRKSGSSLDELLHTWTSCATEMMGGGSRDALPHAPTASTGRPTIMQEVRSITDLLACDDQDFISCLYVSLLGRKPDPKGHRFYLEQLRTTGDKAELIAQIAFSKEARQRPISLIGLKGFLLRRKLARLPLLRWVAWRATTYGGVNSRRILLEAMGRRIATLQEDIAHLQPQLSGKLAVDPKAYVSAVFAAFDAEKYVAANPDVGASGVNPYEHFVRFGWDEGRADRDPPDESTARSKTTAAHSSDPTDVRVEGAPPSRDPRATTGADALAVRVGSPTGLWSCVMQPAFAVEQSARYPLTRLMHFIWSSRADLQQAFDIRHEHGRLELLRWLASHGTDEYVLTAQLFPRSLLEELETAGEHLNGLASLALPPHLHDDGATGALESLGAWNEAPSLGANLVGYAFGEFGRGEDVRMLARSLDRVCVPFCIIDQDPGLHGTRDVSAAHWVTDRPRYLTNIFLVNADLFPFLPFRLSRDFSNGRYNIGYWAWELSEWPVEFTLALEMVDEVWAISEFVAESVKPRARVPVFTLPNSITVPALGPQYTKSHYKLPSESFVFYFMFDGASHVDRKNPIAAVRAFKEAFDPSSTDNVHLLVKAMNVEVASAPWRELLDEIAGSERITVIADRMTRDEVLGLHVACDALVSLHRSEGFGRCIAEAMAYGKPVIVTNYSGSRDFAHEGTACVVDYRLVPVPPNSYPFSTGQVWAEPDIEHAATLMRRVARDAAYREEIAKAGQRYVLENFSEEAVGRLYSQRLEEIRVQRAGEANARELTEKEGSPADPGIFGCIDNPAIESTPEVSEVLSIEGWTTSRDGIETVKVFVDQAYLADAHYGLLRPDVSNAFADFPAAGRSGFCLLVNLADYLDGDHTFRVVAVGRSGHSKAWDGSFRKIPSASFCAWTQRTDELYARAFETRDTRAGRLTLSVALRLQTDLTMGALTDTFRSLARQSYPNMETVCLLAEESQRQLVARAARRAKLTADPVCVLVQRGDWVGALSQCRGDFLGMAEPGDAFRPLAFDIVDRAISDAGSPDLLYADEEVRSTSGASEPVFKPGWSPIFLDSYNYIGRPWFASRKIVDSLLESTRNYPLSEHEFLKAIGGISSVVAHIPTVLVTRPSVTVEAPPPRIARAVDDAEVSGVHPKVSIIIPTTLGNEAIVSRCFEALERNTDYPDFEVIVVVNNVKDPSAVGRHLRSRSFTILNWSGPFNWAGINNFGATYSTGELLLFLNDDVEPLGPQWLLTLVRTLTQTGAGVSGCLLKYRNGTIQHGGVNFVDYGGGARHLFRFCTGDEPRLQWLLRYPREVSAVTGACLLTTRACFNEVGGFDDELALVGNDTDYCLRVWKAARPVVLDPQAQLIHYEGISRHGMPEEKDVERFWSKWGALLDQGDFFTNPNLDMKRDDWFVNPAIDRIFQVRTRQLVADEGGVLDAASTAAPAS